ncbi:protein LrgB [Neisseria gonorrhoeae]|nr:protein LrgB [Neisseria gonorrhoeae]
MSEILRQPGILLFLTLAVYALAIIVRTRHGQYLLQPRTRQHYRADCLPENPRYRLCGVPQRRAIH